MKKGFVLLFAVAAICACSSQSEKREMNTQQTAGTAVTNEAAGAGMTNAPSTNAPSTNAPDLNTNK